MLKINKEIAQEIVNKFVQGNKVINIAKEYKICSENVNSILHGKTWKECNRPANIQNLISSQIRKINQQQAQEIIDKFINNTPVLELAKQYKVSVGNIGCILRGETWKECSRPIDIKTNNNVKINQQQAQEIINRYIAGESSYSLADEYNLWSTSISNLIRGDTWKQCKRPANIQEIIISRDQNKGTKHKELPSLTLLQEDIIVGSLLGDGSMKKLYSKHGNSNSSFYKKQLKTRKSYLDWHYDNMKEYSAKISPILSKEKLSKGVNSTINREIVKPYLAAYAFDTYVHPNLTKIRQEWYPEGVKIIPKNLELNPQRIAIWYFDDGSNNCKQRCAVLCTHSFSLTEVEFLCEKLKNFDLHPSINEIKSKYTEKMMPYLIFRKQSYDNLISLVKPYMLWDCLRYKIEWRPAKQQWEYSSKFTPKNIAQIIELRQTHSAKEIAKKEGVHVNTIYAIISGRSWKHLRQKNT